MQRSGGGCDLCQVPRSRRCPVGSRLGSAILRRMSSEPRKIIARRWKIGAVLTAVMMLGYFGFILLVAFGRDTAGLLLADERISLGIVLGASVILLAPVLTAGYVRWANRHYDPAVQALREEAAQTAATAQAAQAAAPGAP